MPAVALVSAAILLLAPFGARAQAPDARPRNPDARPQPVGTMSELMVDIIYPASDAIFYIDTRTPTESEGWMRLQGQALMLAESANLLMMPGRARDQDQWMRDARLLLEVGQAAYAAARERDVEALGGLNDQLYQSCVQCHRNYRPGYGRRPE